MFHRLSIRFCCLFLLSISFFLGSEAQALSFDWESATDNGATVTQTVGGVTATVTTENSDADVFAGGGAGGSSGDIVRADSSIGNDFVTVSFSTAIDITTVYSWDIAANVSTWTFTPTGGSNSVVNQSVSGVGSSVSLNWTGVTAFTIVSNDPASTAFALDDITFTISNPAPTVTSVSVPSNATYIAGQNLDFTINFDENVTVNTGGGTPQLALTIGATTRQAVYLSGSGTSALVFRYTIQNGDLDTDGISVGTLDANGGTMKDTGGADANLTLNSVGSTSSVLVDAVAPSAPSKPDLVVGSDTGTSSTDDLTNDDTPTFTGTSEANATINFITSPTAGLLSSVTADGGGNWTVTGATFPSGITNVSATATDQAGNTGSASLILSITIDTTVPVISNVVKSSTNTTISATWDTDEVSSTQMGYGLINITNFTTEIDTAPRVTSHSATITGLLPCTTYDVQTRSTDAAGNLISVHHNITTTGCTGVSDGYFAAAQVPNGAPFAVSMVKTLERAQITPPTNYSATCDAFFQFQDLIESGVIGATGGFPTGRAPVMSYALSAYCDISTRLTSFDLPLSIEFTYDDSLISGFQEQTLKIYRWGGASWDVLNNCVVDQGANTVTCETTQFSTFGMFGDPFVQGGGSAPTNDIVRVCQNGKCFNAYPVGNDPYYYVYQNCKDSGKHGDDCAREWALAKGYSLEGSSQYATQIKPVSRVEEYAAAPVYQNTSIFDDVVQDDYYYEAIRWAEDSGIIEGYEEGSSIVFKAYQEVNRVELLKIAMEAAGINTNILCRRFYGYEDVEWDSWYGDYLQAASCAGIVEGYDDEGVLTFKPSQSVNFVEAAKIIVETLGIVVEEREVWYEPYLQVLEDYDAIPPTIRADGQPVTRGEMVYMMYQMMR
ncbi:MAG TPA: Ig-like domain-containing protein [Candidatus Gracilibacteria bacterium]